MKERLEKRMGFASGLLTLKDLLAIVQEGINIAGLPMDFGKPAYRSGLWLATGTYISGGYPLP